MASSKMGWQTVQTGNQEFPGRDISNGEGHLYITKDSIPVFDGTPEWFDEY